MIRLEINPLDQKDIIELLEYALEQKKVDYNKEAYPKNWEIECHNYLLLWMARMLHLVLWNLHFLELLKKKIKKKRYHFIGNDISNYKRKCV